MATDQSKAAEREAPADSAPSRDRPQSESEAESDRQEPFELNDPKDEAKVPQPKLDDEPANGSIEATEAGWQQRRVRWTSRYARQA